MPEGAPTDTSGDGGVATARESLSVTDNRTGKTYELEINDGTDPRDGPARQIKVDDDDFGLMSYDPAFTNTASCRSAITYIDGEAGRARVPRLPDRAALRERHLPRGRLPPDLRRAADDATQLDEWVHEITHHTYVHENIKKFVEGFRYDAHPMGMLLATVGALSTFYPGAKHIKDDEERHMAAVRLIAKMPTLAAFAYRHNLGLPYVYPDNDLSYPGNFLSMMFKMTEVKYEPDPRLERALDVLWILHADHEQNCSTSAVRGVGSSQVDPYSAVAAGVAALYGPLHGGANEAVLRMLDRIGTVGEHPRLPRGREEPRGEADGLRPPRLQELRPARADHQEARGGGVRGHGHEPEARHRRRAREARARRRLLHERKLYPNVDFYSGLIYEALEPAARTCSR